MRHSFASIDPKLIGSNIALARKRAGFTQKALSVALRMSRPTLIAIESGQRRPTPAEVGDAARILGVSPRELLSMAASDDALSVRFRANQEPLGVQDAVRALEDFGRRYVALENMADDRIERREPSVLDLTQRKSLTTAAEELASAERARLGLGDGPLGDLRAILEEDAGLRIFGIQELRNTQVDGLFVYTAALGALVAFNPERDPRRIRWTLCHEYAHFLTNRYDPEITEYQDAYRPSMYEVFANRFSSSFLLPSSGLSRRFSEMLEDAKGELKVAHLILLAYMFQVSFEALTRRLEELKRIKPGTYEFLISKGVKPIALEQSMGIERRNLTFEPFPLRYVYLVTRLYSRGQISEGDVAHYFCIDRLSARELMDKVEAGIDDDSDGLDLTLEAVL